MPDGFTYGLLVVLAAPFLIIHDDVPYPAIRWLLYILVVGLYPLWLVFAAIAALIAVGFERDR